MAKRYKAYTEYKDSGVEWLGEVPRHWKIISLKKVAQFITGMTPPTSIEEYYSDEKTEYPWIRPEDISEELLTLTASRFLTRSGWLTQRIVSKHSTLICCIGTIGKSAYTSESVVTNQQITSAIFKSENKYFYYVICAARTELETRATGNVVKIINSERLGQLSILMGDKKEQQKIAQFLDHETAKMDTLIQKQEQLIELLKEKRQAVISHAVTKGLNPNVSMKDSEVEWLGEVPEGWDVKAYRHVCKIYRGKFGHRPRNHPAFYDGEYPFIQTGDIARASKYIQDYKQTLNDKGIAISQKFPAGTLMMAIAANIGDTAILGFEAYAPDSVVGFKPKTDIDVDFLRYSFIAALPRLEQNSTQSTQANLNIDRIGAIRSSFPSVFEQKKIVVYLDTLLKHYDDIELKSNISINLTKERKTALISAAVTGKIDVRDWQASQ